MNPKRLFVGLDFPASLTTYLAGLDPGIPAVRWLGAEQIHLTLAFLGGVGADEQRTLQEKLASIRVGPFFLPVRGLGTFPEKGDPRVLWVGTGEGHPHLFQLHKRVVEAALAAGLEADLRPWRPHLTLARCEARRPALQRFLKKFAELEAGLVRIEAFHLYSSRPGPAGSVYTKELTVSLA